MIHRASIRGFGFLALASLLAAPGVLADTTVGDPNSYIVQVDTDNFGGGVFRVEDFDGSNPTQTVIQIDAQNADITSDDIDLNGGVDVNGSLSVSGSFSSSSINTSSISTGTLATSGLATLSSANVTNGATVGGTLNANGGTSTTTLSTSGVANLNSANVTNGATIGGTLNANGGTSTTTLGTSGLATLDSAQVTNDASVGGNLGVTGTTTLDGATDVNEDLQVDSNGAAAGGSTLTVDDTRVSLAHGARSLRVESTGTTIEGDLTVNGNIVSDNPLAISGITVGENGMEVDGPSNTVSVVADSDASEPNGRGQIRLAEDEARVLVTNAQGNTHGLVVGTEATTLSGGTETAVLTLDDDGATFADDVTGAPVPVTGVADGRSAFDAVNVRQLEGLDERMVERTKRAYAGVAAVAALSSIPAPAGDDRFAVGVGGGYYSGQSAVAVGARARIWRGLQVNVGVGGGVNEDRVDEDRIAVGAGLSYSF